jgi:hypothetical protein
VVLGGEDVAGSPGDLGTEGGQGLDQDGGLDGHVEGSGNAGTFEDLLGTVLLAEGNETGHLVFSELDLLATESGETNISYRGKEKYLDVNARVTVKLQRGRSMYVIMLLREFNELYVKRKL